MSIEFYLITIITCVIIIPLAVYFVIKDMVNSNTTAKNVAIGVILVALAILFFSLQEIN